MQFLLINEISPLPDITKIFCEANFSEEKPIFPMLTKISKKQKREEKNILAPLINHAYCKIKTGLDKRKSITRGFIILFFMVDGGRGVAYYDFFSKTFSIKGSRKKKFFF